MVDRGVRCAHAWESVFALPPPTPPRRQNEEFYRWLESLEKGFWHCLLSLLVLCVALSTCEHKHRHNPVPGSSSPYLLARSRACRRISPQAKAPHDKSWAEKQAAGFDKWINFTLVGAEELRHSASHHGGSFDKRRGARQRTQAMRLFRSAGMRGVFDAVASRARMAPFR